MATMEERMKASQRRGTAVKVQNNPFDDGNIDIIDLKVENLADAIEISDGELEVIILRLKDSGSNEAILENLEESKTGFLFTTESLQKIIEITTSLKTKLKLISLVAPRLIDPTRAKMEHFSSFFRFAEDKLIVENAFKERLKVINSSKFSRAESLHSNSTDRARMSLGGRGRGRGRGAGRGFFSKLNSTSTVVSDIDIKSTQNIKSRMGRCNTVDVGALSRFKQEIKAENVKG